MFDFSEIIRLAQLGTGNSITQCFLLFMIWLSSMGIRKDIKKDREENKKEFKSVNDKLDDHDKQIKDHAIRIGKLEKPKP